MFRRRLLARSSPHHNMAKTKRLHQEDENSGRRMRRRLNMGKQFSSKRNALKQRQRRSTTPDNKSDAIYIVERVLAYKMVDGKKMAFIKWKGYSDRECTWEPEDAIFDLYTAWKPNNNNLDEVSCAEKVCDASQIADPNKGVAAIAPSETRKEHIQLRSNSQNVLSNDDTADYCCAILTEQLANAVTLRGDSFLPEDFQLDESPLSEPVIVTQPALILDANRAPNVTLIGPSLPPLQATAMERALKLEFVGEADKLPGYKSIDRWSMEDVRDHLRTRTYAQEADRMFEERIDGAALLCINHRQILEQCGISSARSLKLFTEIKLLQSMR